MQYKNHKLLPHSLLAIKNNNISINLAGQRTKYQIIKIVTSINQFQSDQQHYNLLWTDHALSIKQFKQQKSHVKINHFPQITQITRKNKMAVNLNNMKIHFPKEYNFYPQTWILPNDYQKLLKKHTKGKVYIVKPDNSCQGQGIYLSNNPLQLHGQENKIAQQYILNPLLLEGFKFDTRIYVLITSVSPLRVFMYKNGIVRLATQKYINPESENLQNSYLHLTNYAINKTNKNFLVDDNNYSTGHKRLLSTMINQIQLSQFFKKVSKIVLKTIISGLPNIIDSANQIKRNDPNSCFQLLGFDVMLNNSKQPILLQVNQNPSLVTDTKLDFTLKQQLIKNIFNIVTGNYISNFYEKIQLKIRIKDKHQNDKKGNFMKIYPCESLQQTQKYDSFLSKAQQIYRQKFGINIIRNNKKQSNSVSRIQKQFIQWNQNPERYSKTKIQNIYGSRLNRSSQMTKRLVLL